MRTDSRRRVAAQLSDLRPNQRYMPGAHLASFPGLPLPHAACTATFCLQACRASPCTWKGCSYVLRRARPREGGVRPATDPACHCLPPPRLPTLVTIRRRPATPGSPSLSSHTRALRPGHAPEGLPAPRRTSCLQPLPVPTASHPRGLVSPGSRTGTFQYASSSSAPPLAGACRPSSSRAGRPLRRRVDAAVRDAALPDAAPPCCDAPPASPGALTLPPRGPRSPVRAPHRPYAFSRPSL